MKKVLAILTALTLVVSLTACSKDNTTDSSSDTIPTVSQTESTDVSKPTTDSSDVSSETTENTESNTNSEKSEVNTAETNSKTETNKPSTTTSKQETTNKTETSKPAVSSKEETTTEKEETKNNLYFYNDTVDGRWNADSISVVAKEVYFENGQLVAHCFIVNGYSTNATNVNIKQIIVLDKNGTQIAHAYFNSQNLSIAALSYVEHTFTFGADTITSTNVDMSVVTVNSQFHANH